MNFPIALAISAVIYLYWIIRRVNIRYIPANNVFTIDGDTIIIYQKDKKPERIRIENIDAPELRWFGGLIENKDGQQAMTELKRMIEKAEKVKIYGSNRKDKYGRTLARVAVIIKGAQIDVGKHLIKNGLARHWT